MKAIEELKEETGREAIFLCLDLGNLDSIRRSAEEFMRYWLVVFSAESHSDKSNTGRRRSCISW
jgi:DUF1365 family protein